MEGRFASGIKIEISPAGHFPATSLSFSARRSLLMAIVRAGHLADGFRPSQSPRRCPKQAREAL